MHCIKKAEKCNVLFREAYNWTILSFNNGAVKSSEDFQSEHELSGSALIDELCESEREEG